ncbi:MAG: tyrosine-type recombinase/integrase [Prevotellaceae bacterium]|jgi:integrase/recombinase XerC|nr:tyrosine-type recombinase/integrase [Prevotellaceae bacterium]
MINEFLQYLRYEKNYSLHTVLSYHTDLKEFCAFLGVAPEHFQHQDIDSNRIRMWVLALSDSNISSRSIVRKISTLRSYWKFLRRTNRATDNPLARIVLPKANKPLPAFFKEDEMENMLSEEYLPSNYERVRNHLIVKLLYATGIRRAELVGLKDTNIDFARQEIRVVGKRNKERVEPLLPEVITDIKTYINLRNTELEYCAPYLFLLKNGKQLYPEKVNLIVKEVSEGSSTLKKRSPHVLRHTFATAVLNKGADINAVKELLGHSSLAATQVYTHTSFEELNKIYNQTHPRSKA